MLKSLRIQLWFVKDNIHVKRSTRKTKICFFQNYKCITHAWQVGCVTGICCTCFLVRCFVVSCFSIVKSICITKFNSNLWWTSLLLCFCSLHFLHLMRMQMSMSWTIPFWTFFITWQVLEPYWTFFFPFYTK